MARDLFFKYVKSLLNFDSELAGVDPDAGALVAYADLTEKVQAELCAGGFTIVGAPYIGEVAGKSAMVLNGSSAIHFKLGAGLNTTFTVEFEVYIPSLAVISYWFAAGSSVTAIETRITTETGNQLGGTNQNATLSESARGILTLGWHAFSMTYTAGGATHVYLDGVRVMLSGNIGVYGSALSFFQLGRTGSSYAVNGTAIRKLRVYRGIAKYTGASYAVADPGLPSRLTDIDGTHWFENGVPSISAPSKFGPLAARFNGDSGLIHSGFDFSGDFTIEFWLLIEGSTADWPRLVSQIGAAAGSFWLILTPEKNLCLVMRGSGTTVGTRAVGGKVAADGWNHCAIVRKGNAVAFFLGGELQYAIHVSGAIPSANPFAVGCIADSYSATSRLFGAVDGLRVTIGKARYDFAVESNFYNTVFYEHPNGASYPFTNNNRDKAVTQADITALKMADPFGDVNYAAGFNGTTSYARIGQHADLNFGTGDFTVEWWGKNSNTSGKHTIISSSNSSFLSAGAVGIYQNGAHVQLASYENGNPTAIAFGDYSTGWHHFAVVRAGGVLNIYVDGALGATAACALAINFAYTSYTYFGRSGWRTTEYYNGYITDLRVTKGVARYTADFTPTKIVEATGSFTPPTEAFAAAATAVSGVVTDSGNSPCERRVFAYSHADGRFLGDAVSDPVTGVFEIAVPERAFVVALDTDASGQNAIVLDRVDPV